MKILIIGNGARETAIAESISKNPEAIEIYVAKGNAGTLKYATNINLETQEEILDFAIKNDVDLTIVGSEEMLVAGIVDKFQDKNLAIIGPDKKSAMLEGSKAFSKDFMKKYGIKTAMYETFTDSNKAKEYIKEKNIYPVVIKASGLAAGKGVIIAKDEVEAIEAINSLMNDDIFSGAGKEIVIEEFLEGVEASILSITDSETILPFISAKDHKKIGERETGLNTGGMGAIAPNPYVTPGVFEKFNEEILKPTLVGIKKEKMEFSGFIFFGLMITKKGVYLLEYNMRLGDPETQAVLPLLKNDFLDLLISCYHKELKDIKLEWLQKYSCSVVMASLGYPKEYKVGYEIKGLDKVKANVFMAGVRQENGKLLTSGGRVLNVVALGNTLEEARLTAYKEVEKIKFKDSYYRRDIGL